MNEPTAGPKQTSPHYDVCVSVEQFGPIEKGSVDLRPLTIFVGPSNTGKTYLAILIYALHKTLHGFPRFPNIGRYYFSHEETPSLSDSEIEQVILKLNSQDQSVLFSDLPKSMRQSAHSYLRNTQLLGDDLRRELERCFDLESISDLIRMTGRDNASKLSIQISEEGQVLWNFLLGISASDISSGGSISDMELISKRYARSSDKYESMITGLRDHFARVRTVPQTDKLDYVLMELWDILNHHTRTGHAESYYLPAARSGIMQSHRVIASSLVSRSTRAGLERFPELPTFSGVMADFMQRLILFDAPRSFFRVGTRRQQSKAIKGLATELEQRTLAGQILTTRPSPGGYPEFVYRPLEAKQSIRLSRASSMVSELAPVVLFIRGNIGRGDTLIIEEPEAHLHPAAQTEMAATLARLVRCGVRVVVTTHSDWLLKAVGNLMREGELKEQGADSVNDDISSSSLRPQDVGIWLFREDDDSRGSTIREIEFSRIDGIEPTDYETVAEQLYNRSADLQNRFEEMTG